MTKILILTDFDGTITGRKGSDTVFTAFYQSLLQGEGLRKNYKYTLLKSDQEVQQLFEEKFGKYHSNFDYSQKDADLLMSTEAVAFFKEALSKPNYSVKIITKNRADYIQALLKYQGFSNEEIDKIDFDASGSKNSAVYETLRSQKHQEHRPNYIYILDDDEEDYSRMVSATELPEFDYNADQIKKYNENAGHFQWNQYLKDIKTLLAKSKQNQPIETNSIVDLPPSPLELNTPIIEIKSPPNLTNLDSKNVNTEKNPVEEIIQSPLISQNELNAPIMEIESPPNPANSDSKNVNTEKKPVEEIIQSPLIRQNELNAPIIEIKSPPNPTNLDSKKVNTEKKPIEEIKQSPIQKPKTSNFTFKPTIFGFLIGASLGFLVGVLLIVTGVFSPIALGLLELTAIVSALTFGVGALSGIISFISTILYSRSENSLPNEGQSQANTKQLHEGNDHLPLSEQSSLQDAPVDHFPSILKKPNTGKKVEEIEENESTEETSLTNNPSLK